MPQLNASNILSGEPKFVEPSTFDYRLTAGSAAIDQAVGSNVDVDREGQSRPVNDIADVGMDEFSDMTLENVTPSDEMLKVVWRADLDLMPELASFAILYQVGTAPPQVFSVDKAVREYTIVRLKNHVKYKVWVEARDTSGRPLSITETQIAAPTDLHIYLPSLMR